MNLPFAICTYHCPGGSYGMNDLKADLQAMYSKAGVKDEGVLFLFTDGQITNEKFLVFINDLLASGLTEGWLVVFFSLKTQGLIGLECEYKCCIHIYIYRHIYKIYIMNTYIHIYRYDAYIRFSLLFCDPPQNSATL